MTKIKILIPSVGSLVGTSILEELEYIGMRDQVTVIGTNSVPDAINNFRCEACYLVPVTRDLDAFRPRLYEIIKTEMPDLVLAGRDDDTELLAEFKSDPAFKKIQFVAPNPDGAQLVNDKVKTYEFAKRHNLPHAETAHTKDELEALIERAGFPIICKPRKGFASKGITVVANEEQAMNALESEDNENVFQECVGNKEDIVSKIPDLKKGFPLFTSLSPREQYNATILFGKNSEPFRSIYMKVFMELGRGMAQDPWDDPNHTSMAEAYAQKLSEFGYVGSVTIQSLKNADGQYVPFELNGRLGGTSICRAMLGHSELQAIFDHFLYDRRPKPRPSAVPTHLRASKMLTTRVIQLQDVEDLKKNGKWASNSSVIAG